LSLLDGLITRRPSGVDIHIIQFRIRLPKRPVSQLIKFGPVRCPYGELSFSLSVFISPRQLLVVDAGVDRVVVDCFCHPATDIGRS
jgi:hypothetical protein